MYTGSLPPATVHGTWLESIEVWSTDDDTLYDLSAVDEIILTLRDPHSMFDELTLKLSTGEITIPSTGVIQWRAEKATMATLSERLYDVIMTVEGDGDTVPLILGTISILE